MTNFEENFKKLEEVSRQLRDDEISVDELVPKMEVALKAVKNCKSVLVKTKAKITEIDKEFNEVRSSLDELK